MCDNVSFRSTLYTNSRSVSRSTPCQSVLYVRTLCTFTLYYILVKYIKCPMKPINFQFSKLSLTICKHSTVKIHSSSVSKFLIHSQKLTKRDKDCHNEVIIDRYHPDSRVSTLWLWLYNVFMFDNTMVTTKDDVFKPLRTYFKMNETN